MMAAPGRALVRKEMKRLPALFDGGIGHVAVEA